MNRITAPGHLDRHNSLMILISTAVFCGLAVWMVIPAPPTGFYWDDTWYLLMAESLSGRSDHQELAWTMLQLRQYPPLFPFTLSLSGEILVTQQNAFIMNALFLALGAGVAMAWFAREGFPAWTSAVAAVLLMFNPVALSWLPTLFSEHLFILLTTSALALASLRSDRLSLWLGIGIIVGLSVATRSAGWALAAGMLIFLALNGKFNPIPAFVLGLVAGLLTIPFFKAGFPPARSYLEELTENLKNLDWEYLVQQARALLAGWQLLWGSGIGAILAAMLMLPGLGIRLTRNRPDAWYIVVYLAMLIVWPFPEHMSRFLWPLMPAFLVAGYSSVGLFRNAKYSSYVASVTLGFILALSVPGGIGKSLERLVNPPPSELYELSRMREWTRSSDRQMGVGILQTRRQFLHDMRQIAGMTDNGACIYSELSMMVTAQTQRVALASPWRTLDELDSAQIQCPYYYMIPSALPGTTTADVDRFSAVHKELFRSLAPYDPEGKQLLGVFFVLQPPSSQQRDSN